MNGFWDTHMHSEFSGDSDTPMEAQIESAIEKGLAGICFTDHYDPEFPMTAENADMPEGFFLFDTVSYAEKVHALAKKYQNRLQILCGVELGLQTTCTDACRKLLSENNFDYVIGSIHVADGLDPWYQTYWSGRSARDSVRRYFETVLSCINAFPDFDALGHLDYVVRYCKDPAFVYDPADYQDLLDEILRFLIAHGKALELNTGGLRQPSGDTNPCREILLRYRALGGTLLTLGADAHKPEHVALGFDRIRPLLISCDFKSVTVFRGRSPREYLI